MQITTEIIDRVAKKDGLYYMPDRVRIAIEKYIENEEDKVTTEYGRLLDEYQSYEELYEPAVIDYKGAITLDAYTAYYLCRNMLIPFIALRDLALHPFFQEMPQSINILDLGSGTGAVTLGLLVMFSNQLLQPMSLKITAVDSCIEALERQKKIVDDAQFNLHDVEYREIDIKDVNSCIEETSARGPYQLIFSANCLTEVPHEKAIELMVRLPEVLAEDGAVIIAEAQRNYTKALTRKLAREARELGLNVYYPCPPIDCPYSGYPYKFCWVWRYHKYEIPAMKVHDKPLSDEPKDELVATWLILTKQDISICDQFRNAQRDLLWGPISTETGSRRAICCENGKMRFSDDSPFQNRYTRGNIAGLSEEGEVGAYYEI